MAAEACRAVFENGPENERAKRLDAAFPACFCEAWSLAAAGGGGVANDEIVARVLTSPDDYDEQTSTILTSRLTHLYSMGLSVLRQGASDAEILSTVEELMTKGSELHRLVGAVVVNVKNIRSYSTDEKRWFGVYATDDRGKHHHVDVLGTLPPGSGNAIKKEKSKRRHALANDMLPLVLFDADPLSLLNKLREAGI